MAMDATMRISAVVEQRDEIGFGKAALGLDKNLAWNKSLSWRRSIGAGAEAENEQQQNERDPGAPRAKLRNQIVRTRDLF